jgi:hypothetical protein
MLDTGYWILDIFKKHKIYLTTAAKTTFPLGKGRGWGFQTIL